MLASHHRQLSVPSQAARDRCMFAACLTLHAPPLSPSQRLRRGDVAAVQTLAEEAIAPSRLPDLKPSFPVHVDTGLHLSVSVRLLSVFFKCSRTGPTWTAEDYASLWQSHNHEESYAVESIEGAIPADLEVRRTQTLAGSRAPLQPCESAATSKLQSVCMLLMDHGVCKGLHQQIDCAAGRCRAHSTGQVRACLTSTATRCTSLTVRCV